MIDIEKLEQLEQAATPGPWVERGCNLWTVSQCEDLDCCKRPDHHPGYKVAQCHASDGLTRLSESPNRFSLVRENAELIAAARNALPELLAEVKRLREENAGLVASRMSELQTLAQQLSAKAHISANTLPFDHFKEEEYRFATIAFWEFYEKAMDFVRWEQAARRGETEPLALGSPIVRDMVDQADRDNLATMCHALIEENRSLRERVRELENAVLRVTTSAK